MNVRLRDNLTRDDRAALKGLQNRSTGYRLEYALFTLRYCFAFVTINCILYLRKVGRNVQ